MVIEIGCGNGGLLKCLLDKNVSALGIDPYVDIIKLPIGVMGKVLPYEIDRFYDFFM